MTKKGPKNCPPQWFVTPNGLSDAHLGRNIHWRGHLWFHLGMHFLHFFDFNFQHFLFFFISILGTFFYTICWIFFWWIFPFFLCRFLPHFFSRFFRNICGPILPTIFGTGVVHVSAFWVSIWGCILAWLFVANLATRSIFVLEIHSRWPDPHQGMKS